MPFKVILQVLICTDIFFDSKECSDKKSFFVFSIDYFLLVQYQLPYPDIIVSSGPVGICGTCGIVMIAHSIVSDAL